MNEARAGEGPSSVPSELWRELQINTTSVSDGLVMKLEAMILTGKLPIGSRIPPERELAASLGVSRSSLRQALHELELKKLVDRRPGRGTVVTAHTDTSFGGAFSARATEEERTLRDVMDLRMAIEPSVAARAAARATPTGLHRLEQLTEELRNARDPDERARLDMEFHLQLARSTANPLLVSLLQTCTEWMGPVRNRGQNDERHRISLAGHQEIYVGVAKSDAARAEQAMRNHINDILQFVLSEVHET